MYPTNHRTMRINRYADRKIFWPIASSNRRNLAYWCLRGPFGLVVRTAHNSCLWVLGSAGGCTVRKLAADIVLLTRT